jgi:hypothetical protein
MSDSEMGLDPLTKAGSRAEVAAVTLPEALRLESPADSPRGGKLFNPRRFVNALTSPFVQAFLKKGFEEIPYPVRPRSVVAASLLALQCLSRAGTLP